MDDAERRQQECLEHLQEAYDYAEWSKKDREARLPDLTSAQREQMRQYLTMVQQHGLSKGFHDQERCEGCPVMKQQGRAILGIPAEAQRS